MLCIYLLFFNPKKELMHIKFSLKIMFVLCVFPFFLFAQQSIESFSCGVYTKKNNLKSKFTNTLYLQYGEFCTYNDSTIPATYGKVRVPIRIIKIISNSQDVWTDDEIDYFTDYLQKFQDFNIELFIINEKEEHDNQLSYFDLKDATEQASLKDLITDFNDVDKFEPLNLILVDSMINGTTTAAGAATYPGDGDWVFLARYEKSNKLKRAQLVQNIIHEFGHAFGLFHTFEADSSVADPQGSKSCNLGDFISDTPGQGTSHILDACLTYSQEDDECKYNTSICFDHENISLTACLEPSRPSIKLNNGYNITTITHNEQAPLSYTVVGDVTLSATINQDGNHGNTNNIVEWSYEMIGGTLQGNTLSNNLVINGTGPTAIQLQEGQYEFTVREVALYNRNCKGEIIKFILNVINNTDGCNRTDITASTASRNVNTNNIEVRQECLNNYYNITGWINSYEEHNLTAVVYHNGERIRTINDIVTTSPSEISLLTNISLDTDITVEILGYSTSNCAIEVRGDVKGNACATPNDNGTPDLVFATHSLSRSSINPTEDLTIGWTIRNTGSGTTDFRHNEYYLSNDQILDEDDYRWAYDASIDFYRTTLQPGQSISGNRAVNIPWDAAPGTKYVLVKVFASDHEENQNNNVVAIPVSINEVIKEKFNYTDFRRPYYNWLYNFIVPVEDGFFLGMSSDGSGGSGNRSRTTISKIDFNSYTDWTKTQIEEESSLDRLTFGYGAVPIQDGGILFNYSISRFDESTDNGKYFVKLKPDGTIDYSKKLFINGINQNNYTSMLNHNGAIYIAVRGYQGANDDKLFLVKTNENLDIIWSKSYIANDLTSFQNLASTSDGGIIATTNNHKIVKLNANGIIQWSKTIDSDINSIIDIIEKNGFIYVSGGTSKYQNTGETFIAKISVQSGALTWLKTLPTLFSGGRLAINPYANGLILHTERELIAFSEGGDISHVKLQGSDYLHSEVIAANAALFSIISRQHINFNNYLEGVQLVKYNAQLSFCESDEHTLDFNDRTASVSNNNFTIGTPQTVTSTVSNNNVFEEKDIQPLEYELACGNLGTCAENWTIVDDQTNELLFQAENYIETSGIVSVESNEELTFEADYIEVNDGFNMEQGAFFEAIIDPLLTLVMPTII